MGSVELETAALEDLAGRIRGEVIGRTNPDYDAARHVWNGMIERTPEEVIR